MPSSNGRASREPSAQLNEQQQGGQERVLFTCPTESCGATARVKADKGEHIDPTLYTGQG